MTTIYAAVFPTFRVPDKIRRARHCTNGESQPKLFVTPQYRASVRSFSGEHVVEAPPEKWVAMAKEILREVDPVDPEEVPQMLRRIDEALR